nr:glycosyltransferase [Microbacterium ulmi]
MTDDWVEATRSGRESRRLRETDALLLRVADAVVVCSRGLETSRGRVRPVHLVPNAVDVDRYRTPVARPGDLSAGEVALYAGTLHEDRLDVDLVVGTARALRDRGASVVLVGPNALTAENTAILEAQPNVHVLGARPWHAVPAYLQHADVLIVPHVVDGFTESLDPIKLYEYLAVGRPIASTPVAGFRERDGRGVAVARAEDFPEKVAGLIAEQPRTLPAEDVPTWDERVAAMLGILRELPA